LDKFGLRRAAKTRLRLDGTQPLDANDTCVFVNRGLKFENYLE